MQKSRVFDIPKELWYHWSGYKGDIQVIVIQSLQANMRISKPQLAHFCMRYIPVRLVRNMNNKYHDRAHNLRHPVHGTVRLDMSDSGYIDVTMTPYSHPRKTNSCYLMGQSRSYSVRRNYRIEMNLRDQIMYQVINFTEAWGQAGSCLNIILWSQVSAIWDMKLKCLG